MLKFEHVTKVYGGKKALNDLTLSFLPGHVYALVGPNGSGKSTMMKVAAGTGKTQQRQRHLSGNAHRRGK